MLQIVPKKLGVGRLVENGTFVKICKEVVLF